MTDDQLKQAARMLCEMRRQNPDGLVNHGLKPNSDGYVVDIAIQSPRWDLVAEEIKDHLLLHKAIDSVNPLGSIFH